jgi:FMN reductase [NAD(P)H]
MNLHELLFRNRTFRKFRQEDLKKEDLEGILEDVRLAHCANNLQRLRYVLITSTDAKKKVEGIIHFAAKLPPEIGEPKEGEKPAAYIVITEPALKDGSIDIDAGIASEIISESACEKGIGSCIMLNFNVKKMNEIIAVEEGRTARLVIALGIPSHTSEVIQAQNGNVLYTCDEKDYSYQVPKLSVKDLARRI